MSCGTGELGSPAVPAQGADVEALIRFPYAQAVPAGMKAWAEEGFYRPAHQATSGQCWSTWADAATRRRERVAV